jgi:hypothetical protein
MDAHLIVSVLGNFVLITLLVIYGLKLFAEYHARGRWAKNITGLLAGLGMFVLALALVLTPGNADVLAIIAASPTPQILLVISSCLLLAAIAAFGAITYLRPLRLWHERKIERELKRDLPNIP